MLYDLPSYAGTLIAVNLFITFTRKRDRRHVVGAYDMEILPHKKRRFCQLGPTTSHGISF